MKRGLTLIFFLLLGALVNVGVAWSCAAWSPVQSETSAGEDAAGSDSPSRQDARFMRGSGFGVRVLAHVRFLLDDDSGRISTMMIRQINGAGWPRVSFQCSMEATIELEKVRRRDPSQTAALQNWNSGLLPPPWLHSRGYPLPYDPVWTGVLANSLLYGALLWLLLAGPFAVRRHIRRRTGRCVRCGYPAGASPTCTECGAEFRNSHASARRPGGGVRKDRQADH